MSRLAFSIVPALLLLRGTRCLSESKDPRWRELERRIVLSQYQMAAQSAGSRPSAETGLMVVDFWSSQFHMEMVGWHLAHDGLWDRWAMAERAGTKSAANSRRCPSWMACSFILLSGTIPTRSARGNTPIRSASSACCRQ